MVVMRLRRLATIALLLAAACSTSSSGASDPDGIHPQPQPNNGSVSITAPCNTVICGAAPSELQYPKCIPQNGKCTWIDQQTSSYTQCADVECGDAPKADVCPAGTTFKGNTCGAENDNSCAWTTACAPPRSTTPCPDPNGCGSAMPDIGVICQDGDAGALACFLLSTGKCGFDRTCD